MSDLSDLLASEGLIPPEPEALLNEPPHLREPDVMDPMENYIPSAPGSISQDFHIPQEPDIEASIPSVPSSNAEPISCLPSSITSNETACPQLSILVDQTAALPCSSADQGAEFEASIPSAPSESSQTATPSSDKLESLKRRTDALRESFAAKDFAGTNDSEEQSPAKVARRDVGNVDSTEDYIKRLVSYTPGKWRSKPKELTPRICAAHGWYCNEADMLSCAVCNSYVSTPLPVLTASTLPSYNRLIEKYMKLLQSAHKTRCIWKTSTYREPLEEVEPSKLRNAILARYDSLEPIMTDDFAVAKFDDITSEHLKKFDGKKADLVTLAICGWEAAGQSDKIKCVRCQRSTSLFIFGQKKPFDPLEQHYKWCPIFDIGREKAKWKEEIDSIAAIKADRSNLASVMHIKMRMKEVFGDSSKAKANNSS